MDQRSVLVSWAGGDADRWNFQRRPAYTSFLVFELSKLPNFSEPRFRDLGDRQEDRKSELARRQMQTLRQLHGLDEHCTVALRIRKAGTQLRLYVVIRSANEQPLSELDMDRLAGRVQQALPKEYDLARISAVQNPVQWQQATDISWAQYADELIKPETPYPANTWPYFYVASLWAPQSLNDMESVCRALLRCEGEAMVSIELTPTKFNAGEREWIDRCTRVMREAVNGERLYTNDGRTLAKSFSPMPALRAPVENYENLLKQYDSERLFLYSFRVLTAEPPFALTQALATAAARSQAQILSFDRRHPQLRTIVEAARLLNVAPEIRSSWWEGQDQRPLRAQRLHRLADLNEVASFWRLPIPVQAGFPGFELDIGRKTEVAPQQRRRQQIILGQFADDPAHTDAATAFDREGLAKHALVVGVPGSGKTTTMFSILHQLWLPANPEERIPFMVLEPAKTEYRALKDIAAFKEDMLVFTLGDERISPFRFNPFEVPRGVALESHISRLNACFVGAFNLFDPLPLLLDKSIRETYEAKGWLDESLGGELGLESPTLSDLCRQADAVIKRSGYSEKLVNDFNAALIQRLDSLRRGSKGRMLDTRASVPFDVLMQRPVVFELDALNGDEKALLMMFLLTFVYEYAKSTRRSGSPLRHVLLVEEAHNLIGRYGQGGSEQRANPREQAIELFINMLAEMRALGQGILIADQLPTALAPEAMKQTNLKVLMRMTAMDDREEIGNTMDLDEAHLKAVTRFKSGQAYVYLEEWDRVRQVQTVSFKDQYKVEEPPDDQALAATMSSFEAGQPDLFMPFPECPLGCRRCNRRVRSLAERFVVARVDATAGDKFIGFTNDPTQSLCETVLAKVNAEAVRLRHNYGAIDPVFPFCAYVHALHLGADVFSFCERHEKRCACRAQGRDSSFERALQAGLRIT